MVSECMWCALGKKWCCTCVINMYIHTCGQAHALLVRMWSSDPMQRPLFPEMMPTIDALLMPRGGGHGVDRVELDDGLNESDVTMML
jgi:hypothetical protein